MFGGFMFRTIQIYKIILTGTLFYKIRDDFGKFNQSS